MAAPAAAVAACLSLAATAIAADPLVTSEPATGITPHTALVGGTVDPAGTDTDTLLQWGPGATLTGAEQLGPTLTGTGAQAVTQVLVNLTPATTYSFRLVGQRGGAAFPGSTLTFTTTAEPIVTTSPAGASGWNGASVGGTIDPQGADTPWAIEYGETMAYGQISQGFDVVPGVSPTTPVSLRLAGLAPATTYHYRLVALDENGTPAWMGADRTLTTAAEDSATAIAQEVAVAASQVVGATWFARPPRFLTAGVFGIPFSGFPLAGPAFAVISTGAADEVSGLLPGDIADGDAGGAPLVDRGPAAHDVSILQVGLDAPSGATCLSFAFRFLTDETPSPASAFNDAFLAELDASTWSTTDTTLSAPQNFAFGPAGQVMSVNGLSDAPTTQENAAGTPFAWATPILRASTPVTPGPHTLYLSALDQGDPFVDSAVLLDRLEFSSIPATACGGGVVVDSIPLGSVRPGSGTGGVPPASAGVSGVQTAGDPEPVLGSQTVGQVTQGTVLVTPPGGTETRLTGDRAIPLGSRVDTRKGRVRITASSDAGAGRASSEFYGGVFVISQDRRAPVTTVLRLVEDVGLAGCPRGNGARTAAGRRRKPGKRLLWGDGKGRFRTTGQYGAATVRGTKWLVQDSCAGTLVRVSRGAVDARDFTKKRTVRVRAGGTYLARPRR